MNEVDRGVELLNERFSAAAQQPATIVWLVLSIVSVILCVVAAHLLTRDGDGFGRQLALAPIAAMSWIVLGWLIDLLVMGLTGSLTGAIGWQFVVLLVLGVSLTLGWSISEWGHLRVASSITFHLRGRSPTDLETPHAVG